jgi:integrase
MSVELERNYIGEFLEQKDREATRKAYKLGLEYFEKYLKEKKHLTFSQWFDLVDADRAATAKTATNIASNSIRDFAKELAAKELFPVAYSPNSINQFCAAVLSCVKYIYRGRYQITAAYANLPAPDPISGKEEWTLKSISEFYLSMDKQVYRALLTVIFQSGQGIEEILNIRYRDIKEEFEAGITPLCLSMKRKKTGVIYYTFLGALAVAELKKYFNEVGTPQPDQPIFHSTLPGQEMNPLSKSGIERYFARRAKYCLGKEWIGENPRRPHSLRGAFQKLLLLALMAEIFSEFFMGHEVSRNKQAYVIKGMGKEEFRGIYRQYEIALTFETQNQKVKKLD